MEKLIFKGRLLSLFKAKARMPHGYIADLEVIKHPGAALIIPFLAKDKIILIKQFRPVINKYIYELPAGTLAKGESPLSCARREIIEETGYRAKKFTRLGLIYPVPGYSTEKIVIFKAESLKKESAMPEEDECITSKPASRKEIKRLFNKGMIFDAKTICALAFCGWL